MKIATVSVGNGCCLGTIQQFFSDVNINKLTQKTLQFCCNPLDCFMIDATVGNRETCMTLHICEMKIEKSALTCRMQTKNLFV